MLTLSFQDYNLTPKKMDLIVSENTNASLWHKFYISKKVENLSPRTLHVYQKNLEMFDDLIKKPFLQVTTDDIRVFLAILMNRNPNVSENYLDNTRRYLSTFFKFLVDEEFIRINPVAKIKKIRGNTAVKEPFCDLDVEKIRNSCKNPLEKVIIELLLSTAMRKAELCGIKISDINFNKNEIKIIGKGNKLRYVYLNAKSQIALNEYFNFRKEHNYNSDYLLVRHNTITCQELSGQPFDEGTIYAVISRIGKRAKVPHANPHRFRRTVATNWVRKGMAIEKVSELLGHNSLETTMIYVKINRDDVRAEHHRLTD